MILNVKTQKIGADNTSVFVFPTNSTRFMVKNLTSYGVTVVLGDDTEGCYIPSGYTQIIVCADNNTNSNPGTKIVTVHGKQEDNRVVGVEVQSLPFNMDVEMPRQIATITPFTQIATAEVGGVTAPVKGATAVTSVTATDEYTGTVAWTPELASGKFAANTAYTAVITLTPKSGYSAFGVSKNFFTVSGATATNDANSNVISAVFPKTEA